MPESVVSSKTVAEFKHRLGLSEVDLSSVLKYDFNNSTGYMLVFMLITLYITIDVSMYLYNFISVCIFSCF